MPRAKNAKAEVALNLYRQGVLLKDIAAQLGVPEGTIRSWKKRYWENATLQKKECNVANENAKKVKAVNADVESVNENAELTEKQRLFCMFYVRCFNATKAYQKAYQCSYQMACGHGHELLKNVEIKNEIQRLKQSRLNRELLDESDIFQKYVDIAFADITDYLEFGTEEVPVMALYGPVKVKDPDTGEEKELTKTVNTVRFRSSAEVDGTIVAEVKQGRDGASIKLADRMKALDWLAAHMDLATDEQRARIAQIKAQTERLSTQPVENEDDGVEIINDADEKTSQDIRDSNTEVSSGV